MIARCTCQPTSLRVESLKLLYIIGPFKKKKKTNPIKKKVKDNNEGQNAKFNWFHQTPKISDSYL